MTQRKLEYSGGNPWNPDFGQIMSRQNDLPDRELVCFHPDCFDADGMWRQDVVAQLMDIILIYWSGVRATRTDEK